MKMSKTYIGMKSQLLLSIFLVFLLFAACDKMLDTKPDNQFGDEFTWSLPDKAEGVLVNAYANIMTQWDHWSGNNFLDVATDDAVTNDFSSGLYSMAFGSLSNQSNPIGNWNNAYNQFRNIHLFLENGLNDSIRYSVVDEEVEQAMRNRLLGEAYFLRAWWGMELLRIYGGIAEDGQALGYVIITRNLSMDDLQNVEGLQRNTYE
jgi:starch-binding outer membrane protein, SusD/RagB family